MIYSYKCACGSTLEVERSIHDDAMAPMCMDCHATMQRTWDAPPITFRGKGFYTTDNPK